MSSIISVLLVDDHAVVREGYRRLLEKDPSIRVISEAANAGEAYQQYRTCHPDVVVMDIALPQVSGLEGMRRILAFQQDACVLMFSMYEDTIFPIQALEAGARGYITKASAPEILVEAIHAVAAGTRYLSADVEKALACHADLEDEKNVSSLTAREFEILRLIAHGYTVEAIAQKIFLTSKTVANHQSSIKKKLGADNSAQLVRIAMKLGVAS